MSPLTAVFPVGGFGTRFLPATKAIPKEMLPVVDKPLIQYSVEEAKKAGLTKFIFVTGRGKSVIENHFDVHPELEDALQRQQKNTLSQELQDISFEPGQIIYTRQPYPMGLGHAIWCARHYVQEDAFAVLLPDDLIMASPTCLEQMLTVYRKNPGIILAIMPVSKDQTNLYGIIEPIHQEGSVVKIGNIIEKPKPDEAPSCLAVIGRYILPKSIFDILEHQKQGVGGEIQITDAIAHLIQDMPVYGCIFDGQRFDCGIKTGLIEANVAFAMQNSDMAQLLKQKLRTWLD